jgi:hypothetical protein
VREDHERRDLIEREIIKIESHLKILLMGSD